MVVVVNYQTLMVFLVALEVVVEEATHLAAQEELVTHQVQAHHKEATVVQVEIIVAVVVVAQMLLVLMVVLE